MPTLSEMNPFKACKWSRKKQKLPKKNKSIIRAYKDKDRERKRASGKKVLSPLEAEKQRIKCRQRGRLHRLKKKAAATGTPALAHDPSVITFAYKSP